MVRITYNLIKFPSVPTYYISYNNDKAFYHYGVTNPDQQTENIHECMHKFTDKNEYLDKAAELGIEIVED